METRKSSGMSFTEAAAAVTDSRLAFTKVSGGILHAAIRHFVGNGVDQFNVANAAGRLFHGPGNSFITFATEPRRASLLKCPYQLCPSTQS